MLNFNFILFSISECMKLENILKCMRFATYGNLVKAGRIEKNVLMLLAKFRFLSHGMRSVATCHCWNYERLMKTSGNLSCMSI